MSYEIHEKINLEKLEQCMKARPEDRDLFEKINKFYKPIKKGSKCGVHVVKLNFNGFGRPYDENNLSLATIKSEYRKFISVPCVDFDIKNSQPTIIKKICDENNILCPLLTNYVDNREEWLEFTTKDEIIRILNGQLVKKDNSQEKLYFLYNEVSTISEILSKLSKYKKIKIKSQTKQIELNPKNLLHFIYADLENKITKLSMDALIEKYGIKIHINSYIYDGFLVQLSKYVNKNEILEFLNTLHNGIIYTIKPFNENEIFDFDNENLEDPYIITKKEFEQKHCKIINKSFFVKNEKNETHYFKESTLITSYKHLPDKFIYNWLKDPEIKIYDDVGIYPNNSKCPSNIYNTWIPFECENVIPYIYKQKSIDMFLKHLLILCGNEQQIFDYFLKWNAQMIQYPEIKTIVPTLISNQGAGKGLYLEIMRKMLGEKKVYETSNPSRDVWGDHNELMRDCFLVNCNELSKKDTKDAEGIIKTLVTDRSLTINIKGVPKFEITSYHRFINTTNNQDPINTSSDDRRNFIVRCSDELIGNKEYVDKYIQMINDHDSIKSIYTYLKKIPEMENFYKLKIPISEHHELLKEQNKPIELQFMEYIAFEKFEKSEIIKCKASEIMEWFNYFLMTNNITNYHINSIKLGVRITLLKLNGIEKKYDNKGTNYLINIQDLKKNFNFIKNG